MTATLKTCIAVLALVVASAVPAAAQNLTGKWSGTFIVTMDSNPPKDDVAFMVIAHKDAEITGTVGPRETQQWPIAKAKLETVKEGGKDVTRLTFETKGPDGQAGPTLHFVLALVDGRLKGKAQAEHEGSKMSAVVDLGRVK